MPLFLHILQWAFGSTNACAQSVSGIADSVSNGLPSFGGFDSLALTIRTNILLLIVPVGIFIVVRAGLRLVNSQDEGKLETAKRTIAATCVGMMLAYVSNEMVGAFYSPGGAWDPQTGADILAREIGGIVDWVLVLVAVLGVLMIVASALQVVGSFGKEDTSQLRRTVAGTVTGIGIILISGAVKLTLGLTEGTDAALPGSPDADPIIDKVIAIVRNLMMYLSLVAMAIIIYAGLMMILSVGNEEQYGKSKSLIIRVAIGLIVILFSGLLLIFVMNVVQGNAN